MPRRVFGLGVACLLGMWLSVVVSGCGGTTASSGGKMNSSSGQSDKTSKPRVPESDRG